MNPHSVKKEKKIYKNRKFFLPLSILLIILLFMPNKLIQSIIIFFMAVLIFSKLYSAILKKSINVYRTMPEIRTNRLDSVEITLYIENNCILPCPVCFVSDRPGTLCKTESPGRVIFSIQGRERTSFSYTLTGYQRGVYHVGPIFIQGSDPLELFPFEKQIDSLCSIIVRPTRINQPISIKTGFPQGYISVKDKRYEDITMYRSIRDYKTGDELKRINWTVSARFGKLYTNEYQESLSCPVFVFLNLSEEEYPLRLKWDIGESAIETVASIITSASLQGQNCGFSTTGCFEDSDDKEFTFLLPRSNQSNCILDLLSKIQLSKTTLFRTTILERSIVSTPAGSVFYYVGPTLTTENQGIFEQKLFSMAIANSITLRIIYCGTRE